MPSCWPRGARWKPSICLPWSAPLLKSPSASSKTITENEARLLREVLEECNWNKTTAALRLGISRSTLYEKIKKYQIFAPTLH